MLLSKIAQASIRQKVFASSVTIILMITVSALFGTIGSYQIVNSAKSVGDKEFPMMSHADTLNEIVRETNQSLISGYEELDEDMIQIVIDLRVKFLATVEKMQAIAEEDELRHIELTYLKYVIHGRDMLYKIIETEDALNVAKDLGKMAKVALDLMSSIKAYKEAKRIEFKDNLELIEENSVRFKFIISLTSVVSLIIIFTLTLLGTQILESLRGLVDSSKRLSSGNMNEVFQITRTDELGTLQKSFEDMRVALKNHILSLEETNEELTQFSYRTSHDLKAPLVTIRGYLYLLEQEIEKGNTEGLGNYCKRMDHNIQKLEVLISEIMNLNKSSHVEEDAEEIVFDKVLKSVKENLEGMFKDSEVKLILEIRHGSSFSSYRRKISQVIENLVSNSLKYYKEEIRDRKVWVTTKTLDDGQLELVIRDNGIGIPEKHQKGVFSMFFRASPDRSFGSGLGLYLVKKNVDKLQGKIRFTSSGEGTSFILTLPNLDV